MVHRRKVWVVSGIYGTPISPVRESYLAFTNDELTAKVNLLRREGNAKLITVERDGVNYVKALTMIGGLQARSQLQHDIPRRVEVVRL